MARFFTPEWICLLLFFLSYTLFVLFPNRRSWTACGGALLLVLTGVAPWREALFEMISWNVIGLFCGTLVLADLFLQSRVPVVIAQALVERAPSTRMAMMALCALSGVISIFVENVAVVLLVAPVALSLTERLKMNPAPLLIGIAISSNVQGTATMVGDPPSMILAGFMKMGFWDFFIYQGKLSIFFAIQAGAIASLVVLFFIFRKYGKREQISFDEKARSWVPSILLVILIVGLSLASVIDPEFKWFAGCYTLFLSVVGLIWYRFAAKWGRIRPLLRTKDWDTAICLVGVFVLAGGLGASGWLDKLGQWLSGAVGGSVFLVFLCVILFSVLVSGFVDNVPFLLVMLPVCMRMAEQLHVSVQLLLFGLLIGACLGGNITPIGASANVVTLGLLRKRGITVTFADFMRISIPFTLAALTFGALFVWLVYGGAR
ncbi:MAG: anion permease [Kiritimatiellae bacterium]|nr:anion permease [Kiritimatiellia bacterium]